MVLDTYTPPNPLMKAYPELVLNILNIIKIGKIKTFPKLHYFLLNLPNLVAIALIAR